MPPIMTTAEIDRPAAEVFACATDPARFSQWQKGVVDGIRRSTAVAVLGVAAVAAPRWSLVGPG